MISQAAWRKYIDKLAAIDKKAANLMKAWIDQHGLQDEEALIRYAYGLATKYGETSAALSANMYDQMAEMMEADVPAAVPAETASLDEVRKGTMWGKYHSPSQIPSIIGRQTRQAGADTMIQNAKRDNAQWAWVPQGDSCAFCITLASNGWQKASSAVMRGNHAEHIHQNCDCTFAIAFKEKDKRQYDYIYDPKKYRDMYYGADGSSPNERINAIRRQIYQRNKDEINAQKRDAYQASKFDNAFYGLPKSMENLPRIQGNPNIREIVDSINPYDDRRNCVSCMNALALRLQGVDAIAIQSSDPSYKTVDHPWELWGIDVPQISTVENLKSSIEEDMEKWGNNAICQISAYIEINGHIFGHGFIAFRHQNKTYYLDPQTKDLNAEFYFDHLLKIHPGTLQPMEHYYYRVDGVELSQKGKDMVKFGNG